MKRIDKIRALSDEELAELLAGMTFLCEQCLMQDVCDYMEADCEGAVARYLMEDAE